MSITQKICLNNFFSCYILIFSEKILGTPRIRKNCTHSSHIYDGFHYEFSKWILR